MTIPEKIKIGRKIYTVEQGERRPHPDGTLCGEIDSINGTIYLYDKLDGDDKVVTLLHEIIHGICFQRGQEISEGLIDAIAEGFFLLFKDNPELRFNE